MKNRLEILLTKYNFQKKAFEYEATIQSIEKYFEIKLPDDYKYFLQKYSAFEDFINVEYVKLWEAEELIEFNKSYEIQKYMLNTIGIGSNGNSEIIAMEFNKTDNNQIVLTPIDLDTEYNINIGKDFTEFLNRLDTGKGWFD
ncbi:SMI1/KNR4 family protein [Flavobacterium nitratireducens]|uniref:SMI1/KNR4 family protein n=1 Tax=Flavobacterium nitratireducens TaxID=992289 RepID=UPI00241515A1|nr:SMI1/KNR4 family protein [Flavobacterium nitratireducens]